jgi:CheY-like chemotaxis protein
MSSLRRNELIRALPYVRRYARALAGSQPTGDALVAEGLKEMMGADEAAVDLRRDLYRWVTQRFDISAGVAKPNEKLSAKQRQLLLLTSLEEMSIKDAASIVGLELQVASDALAEARRRVRDAAATDVLIIEDEPIIAMDIEELVESCGHRVIGVATSEKEAVEMAQKTRPGLILADINLGAGGDGSSAVTRIMRTHYAPVIFVTAYPEKLLTGNTVEPAFVITKPFEPLTLAIATYQAVTGGLPLE